MKSIHGVREQFNLETFLHSRELSMQVVHKVRDSIKLGMTEDEGSKLIDVVLKEMGCEKKWHPNKFRIEANTTKSFSDKSEPGHVIQEGSVYFIDIGPVFNGHEGDYGNTFVFGDHAEKEKMAQACREVFNQTAKVWKEENKTGVELYLFAEKIANELGYEFNKEMSGHRIGDFPHHLFYRGGMADVEEMPCDNLWILEIHILSKDQKLGAFFEDILKK